MGKRKLESLPDEMPKRYWLRSRPNSQTLSNSRQSEVIKPETVVGYNVDIFKKILDHVAAQDLINCRLVNTRWTPVATARLIQINKPCYFQYHYIKKCYITNGKKLSELIECARNSDRFPCTSFIFRAGDMCSQDANEFLTAMGNSVKTLTLDAVDNWSLTGKMNLSTILSHTPNLETIIFTGGSYYDSKDTDRLMLPSLKCIKIDCHFDDLSIKLLLNGAPNLENIVGAWRLYDLEPIVTMNKIHTIKSWCPGKFSFSAGLIKLATATEVKLSLSELVVYIADQNFHRRSLDEVDTDLLWKCFHKILSKNTIQKLILSASNYPANASLPMNMDNVKELVLMPNSHSAFKHFPVNINLGCTFPRLNTLSFYDPLYDVCCAGRDWANHFPLSDEFGDFSETFPLVTTLNLRGESTSIQMLRKMKKICPNVQNLEICLHKKSDKTKIVKEIWGEWRQLKKLSVDLSNLELADYLDTTITGLSQTYIESLNSGRSSTTAKKLKKIEDMRHILWIGNISGLIQLDIKYKVPYSQQSKDKILIPFTRSSGMYAFNLMPSLKVNLHHSKCTKSEELKKALHSISPFATIIESPGYKPY